MIPMIKVKLSNMKGRKVIGVGGIHLKGKVEIRLRDISNGEESE